MSIYHQSGTTLTVDYIQPDPFRSLISPNEKYQFPSSNLIILQPRKVNYNPAVLGNTTHVYTTPNIADIKNLALYFGDWGCDFEIQEGPVFTMTVNCPWDTITNEDFSVSEYASEQWELIPNSNVTSLLFSNLYANSFVGNNTVMLPDVLKVAVQRSYDNKANFIALPSGSSVITSSFIPYAQTILDYMRFGIEGIPNHTQTLRRTAVVDKQNLNRAFDKTIDQQLRSFSETNGTVNFLISTPDLCRNYAIPTDTIGKLMLPSYRKNISVSNFQNSSYSVFASWLVSPPTYIALTRNKIQLQQTFVWNEYLDHLYYIWSRSTDFPLIDNVTNNPPSMGASR